MKQRHRYAEHLAAVLVGMVAVGMVATVWEAAGRFSHGPVRFIVSSALISLLAYVLHAKPEAKS